MQISLIQTDVEFAAPAANLQTMQKHVTAESAEGSRLIAFPECFTTGYCFDSLEEAMSVAEPADGDTIAQVTQMCHEANCYTVFGFLEQDGTQLFNAAALVGPEGLVGCYRKVHLPFLGVDRFTTPGNRPFEVLSADDVRVGLLICYDGGFPEASRVLGIQGADVILLPTNWPPGAEYMSQFSLNARAMENGVYFGAINRVGTERGFSFIGRSRLCDPVGATLQSSDDDEAVVLRGVVRTDRSRAKRIVRVPGKHIIDRMADRRPEMYGPLCEPHGLKTPHADADGPAST
ncbi:MAG: carbon-nitrogen hydrolase family protein [Planctomycetaceae bacterium]|nr:carbon-nitrogen hydrolase family protein [Planctomycetaceae bacterium]